MVIQFPKDSVPRGRVGLGTDYGSWVGQEEKIWREKAKLIIIARVPPLTGGPSPLKSVRTQDRPRVLGVGGKKNFPWP